MMSPSINYSHFTDLLLNRDDEDKPMRNHLISPDKKHKSQSKNNHAESNSFDQSKK